MKLAQYGSDRALAHTTMIWNFESSTDTISILIHWRIFQKTKGDQLGSAPQTPSATGTGVSSHPAGLTGTFQGSYYAYK